MVLEEDPPPVTFDDVLDDIFGRAEDLARRVTNKVKRDLHQLAQEPPRVAYQRVRQAAPRPRAAAPPPPPQRSEPDPREVLGFAPGVKLTRETIKARQRELARIFHTDRGGNDNAMKRINVAAKTLLDGL